MTKNFSIAPTVAKKSEDFIEVREHAQELMREVEVCRTFGKDVFLYMMACDFKSAQQSFAIIGNFISMLLLYRVTFF